MSIIPPNGNNFYDCKCIKIFKSIGIRFYIPNTYRYMIDSIGYHVWDGGNFYTFDDRYEFYSYFTTIEKERESNINKVLYE